MEKRETEELGQRGSTSSEGELGECIGKIEVAERAPEPWTAYCALQGRDTEAVVGEGRGSDEKESGGIGKMGLREHCLMDTSSSVRKG